METVVWKEAWILVKNCSVDEHTCKMQGKSEYKTRCGKFKRLGDGLQTGCIDDDGYTDDFYFSNEPIDKKWLKKDMCPMHACILHVFSNFRDCGHQLKMGNLFSSVKFAIEAYSLPQKVMICGAIHKSWCGVPPCVLQTELTGKQADLARGKVNVAVLKNDGMSSNLVITSCYDQKSFYMISHRTQQITWVEQEKKMCSNQFQTNS